MKSGGVYRALYVLFALGTAHLLILAALELQRGVALRQEIAIVAGQTEALAAEVEALKSELAHADDPAYLEAKARALGYVYPEEVLRAPSR
ncbi:septum formation initiator family protein [Oceanithermus sp.]|uniref:FtsB family cell division protein n=1 Tax=Oceanithermus sp. TaxID=2268145 RepID=UPI0025E5DB90|nr:septum formation initiator family protein [Oceanithermus sp.]